MIILVAYRTEDGGFIQRCEVGRDGGLVPIGAPVPRKAPKAQPKPAGRVWDGVPWPLRIRLRWPWYIKRCPGCGCLKPVKRLWLKWKGRRVSNGESIRQRGVSRKLWAEGKV